MIRTPETEELTMNTSKFCLSSTQNEPSSVLFLVWIVVNVNRLALYAANKTELN